MLLGYLCGLRGKMLLALVLDPSCSTARPPSCTDLASEASRQGWLNYKAAGGVVEITLPRDPGEES